MANTNYVCTVCSQTFTRKWRARVHTKNIHLGLGGTVRLVDYIIGRINGQYLPSDPSIFRRKNRSAYGNSGYENQYNYQGSDQTGRPIMYRTEEAKTQFRNNTVDSPLRSQPFNSDSQTPHSVSNASTSSESDQFLQSQRAITKMARLKEILSKYYPPNEVQKTLSEIWICCLGKRDYSLADTALNIFNAVDEFRKSTDHPGKT